MTLSPPSSSTEAEPLRPRLFGLAYRMLGTVHDAEDVVQDVYLRWHTADRAAIETPEAWLVAVATRLAIDRLRRTTTERTAYDGNWLPEPIAADRWPAEQQAERASDLSMAFLVLLERLGPEERAAFLLRDVFDTGYDEIARVLERSEVAARQVVHRARTRVRAGRARFATPEASRSLLPRLLDALETGDRDALLSLVTDDVTFTSDGGGKAPAMRARIVGRDPVGRLLSGFHDKGRGLLEHRVVQVSGGPAILAYATGRIVMATFARIEGEHITELYRVLNPDKLGHLGAPVHDWGL